MGKLCVEGRTEEMRKSSLWGFRGESVGKDLWEGVLHNLWEGVLIIKTIKSRVPVYKRRDRVGVGNGETSCLLSLQTSPTETLAPEATVYMQRWMVQALCFTAS